MVSGCRENAVPNTEQATATAATAAASGAPCGGLTLPQGFCATVFADSIGHARHVVVARNGDVYVNTWSGSYYPDSSPLPGGFLVALRDTNHDGRADVVRRFGATGAGGGHGGTGIALYHDALYAEAGGAIVRYPSGTAGLDPQGPPDTVVAGMPVDGDHPMHPFAIDSSGALFVDMGSATNACQAKNRVAGSPGFFPCTERGTRGGIWAYSANTAGQLVSPTQRYATGEQREPSFRAAYDVAQVQKAIMRSWESAGWETVKY